MRKVILVTRTDKKDFDKCQVILKERFRESNLIKKIYIICDDKNKKGFRIGIIECEVIFDNDKKPTRPTSFNLVIEELNKDKNKKNKYHLLTYSKEVDLRKENIEKMIKEIENDKDHLIVVGYRLRDNVLSPEEQSSYKDTIAYKVPWNTCALWNKKFVYGNETEKLRFDKICDKNNLGNLEVTVYDHQVITKYEGMEDGLAIAELITRNEGLKYELIGDNYLSWWIDIDENRKFKQKVKMARKSIVLATFMNIKGYSINKLMEAEL